MAPLVACLLPARNAAIDLPGWFESVERFADVVVALDDGSTDETGEILRSHHLTHRVLTNPMRESYEGWDDADNRNRLVAALDDLAPTWVMQLDADERIDAADAAALRRGVESGGLDPADAFLFRVHRMIGDDGAFDEAELWVGRMFAHRPAARLPTTRLHFVALPDDIAKDRWRHTTIRIQHFGSSTAEKRELRRSKYAVVDPRNEFQDSYDHIERPPGRLRVWPARAPHLPFIVHGAGEPSGPVPDSTPAMSTIVLCQDDEATIATSLDALEGQVCDEPFEIVVVCSGTDDTARIVEDRFPSARLVELDEPALPGAARTAGLAVARGAFACFPGSHIVVEPGYVQALVRRHREGWGMVTPSFRHAQSSRSSWANFFLDHSAKLAGRPSERLTVEPSTASYRRDAIDWAGGFVDLRAGEDTAMNRALWDAGYGCWFEPLASQHHQTPATSVHRLVRHHSTRGIGLAHLLEQERGRGQLFTRSGLRRWGPLYVVARVRRIRGRVLSTGSPAEIREFRRAIDLVVIAALVNWGSGWARFLAGRIRMRRHSGIR